MALVDVVQLAACARARVLLAMSHIKINYIVAEKFYMIY
jgi:hypothetical protein